MASSRTSRRRLLPFALGAAGVVAVLAVLGLTGSDGGWIGSLWRSAPEEPTPEELSAAAQPADAATRGPKLLASGEAKPRETHGPVTVSVVDRANEAVEGACVVAVVLSPPDTEGNTSQERLEQALTDAAGRARFADLPYDGRATVSARARAPGDPAEMARTQAAIRLGVSFIKRLPSGSSAQDPATAGDGEGLVISGSQLPEGSATDPTTPLVFRFTSPGIGQERPQLFDAGIAGGLPLAVAQVTGPEVTLSIDRGIPLEVQVREGGEGRLRPDARWQVRPRLAWPDDAYGAATLPLTRGKQANVTCRVEAPKGFIARREAEWNVFVHPLAQRLVAVYPLRPAVDVLLVVPREAMPYRAEDWEGTITVAGITLEEPDLHVDAQGRLCLRGGAHVMGDSVAVNGTLGKRFHVNGVGFIGPDPRPPVLVEVTLTPVAPPAQATPEGLAVLFDKSSSLTWASGEGQFGIVLGDGVRFRVGTEMPSFSQEIQDWQELAARQAEAERLRLASLAPLPVRAVAWDGSPAAGALLRLGDQELVADAQGRALFRDVAPGAASVLVLGAGATTTAMVEVGPAPRSEAVLTARAGGTLEVEVVDSEGRPLPYVHIDITQDDGQTYMDCVDGVQRLDPYTDEVGRRTCRAVAAGTVKVRALFGTRSAEREIALTDGGREVVRIELPIHAPPPPPEPDAPAAK